MWRKLLLLGAGLGMVVSAGPALAGSASGNGAFREPLAPASGTKCSNPGAPSGTVAGFAILNKNGQPDGTGDVLGEISVKNTPGTFLAFLRNTDNSSECVPLGMIVTNNQGNGNLHYDVPMQSDGHYFIELDDNANNIRYATPPVQLI